MQKMQVNIYLEIFQIHTESSYDESILISHSISRQKLLTSHQFDSEAALKTRAVDEEVDLSQLVDWTQNQFNPANAFNKPTVSNRHWIV